MQPNDIDRLKSEHPEYWKDTLAKIPDNHTAAIERLFSEVTRISGGRRLIEIDMVHTGTDISASMRPVVDLDEISADQKASLFDLVKKFGGHYAAR